MRGSVQQTGRFLSARMALIGRRIRLAARLPVLAARYRRPSRRQAPACPIPLPRFGCPAHGIGHRRPPRNRPAIARVLPAPARAGHSSRRHVGKSAMPPGRPGNQAMGGEARRVRPGFRPRRRRPPSAQPSPHGRKSTSGAQRLHRIAGGFPGHHPERFDRQIAINLRTTMGCTSTMPPWPNAVGARRNDRQRAAGRPHPACSSMPEPRPRNSTGP